MEGASSTAPPSGGAPTVARLDPKRAQAALAILASMGLMVTYVETMVVPALVRFTTFFDNPPISTVAWILSAYLLVGVATTPIFAKLGDIYGKKRILLIVIATYSVAVTLAGFTPQIGAAAGLSRFNQIYLLIGVRGVQGLGMAMFPLAFAMIGEEFPPNRVATAQGIVSAMFAAGATLGLLGGAAITQDFGWQTTYHTVIPVAIGLTILTAVMLRESPFRLQRPLDLPGSAFLGIALGTFLVGLTQGPYWGWGNWSAVAAGGLRLGVPEMFVLAALFAAAFLVWEPRARSPIVDFKRLAERNIWISNVVAVIAGAAMFLTFVANSFLAQVPVVGLGYTVLQFGLMSIPTSVSMMLLAPVVGRAIPRIGPKPVMILGSLLITGGGGLLFVLNKSTFPLPTGGGNSAAVPTMLFTTIPVLVGVIICFISMTNIIVLSSRREETGIQNGMNATFRTLGQSLGPAIASTILSSFTAIVFLPVGVANGVPVFAPKALPTLAAFQYVYAVAAVLGVLSTILCAFLINYRFSADGLRHDDAAKADAPTRRAGAVEPTPSARPAGEGGAGTARALDHVGQLLVGDREPSGP